ncbi:MAG: palmdelphin [Proteus vulgaris]
MTIKDSLTHESLVRDNHLILPDDGLDHTQCHIDRLHASARARTKAPYQPKVKPQKTTR